MFPFSELLTADEINAEATRLITSLEKTYNEVTLTKVSELNEDEIFSATFGKLNDVDGAAARESVKVVLPRLVHGEADARSASAKAHADLEVTFKRLLSSPALYEVLQAAESRLKETGITLTAEQTHLINLVILDCKMAGAALSPDEREAFLALQKELSDEQAAFEKEINEDTSSVWAKKADLAGCPDNFVSSLSKRQGETEEEFEILMKAHHTGVVLKFCDVEATRKAVFEAQQVKCAGANKERLLKMLRLRHALAHDYLGYPSFAAMSLSRTVAGSPDHAVDFLKDTLVKLQPLYEDNIKILAKAGASPEETAADWNRTYFAAKAKVVEVNGGDAEMEKQLANYFELNVSLKAVLEVYEALFRVKFVEVANAAWHADVRTFALLDATKLSDCELEELSVKISNKDVASLGGRSGSDLDSLAGYIGTAVFDMSPRPGKYSHQCVFPLLPAYVAVETETQGDATQRSCSKPACALLCNMGTPVGDSGKKILQPTEVRTLFHEVGHLMHALLAGRDMHALAGVSSANKSTTAKFARHAWAWAVVPWRGGVEMDMLEVPSQMFENWAVDTDRVLGVKIGFHHETGERLSANHLDAIVRGRSFLEALGLVRLGWMSLYDLAIHSSPNAGSGLFEGIYPVGKEQAACSIDELWFKMKDAWTGSEGAAAPVEGAFPPASWYHMTTYASNYYSYMWALVYAEDCFDRVRELRRQNVSEEQIGDKLSVCLLAPGAALPGTQLLRDFLQRESSAEGFLRMLRGEEC